MAIWFVSLCALAGPGWPGFPIPRGRIDLHNLRPSVPSFASVNDPAPYPERVVNFGTIRGANYVPSYARNHLWMWRQYQDRIPVVEKELTYAASLDLNSLRVFLSYAAYEENPTLFLNNVGDFLQRCQAHGLSALLVLFDGCFGVSPSPETQNEYWVANPGPLRTHPAFYEKGARYVDDLMLLALDHENVLLVDIMNEPLSTTLIKTEPGLQRIWDFVSYFIFYINANPAYDPVPRTVGMSLDRKYLMLGNSAYVPINVYSIHCYKAVAPQGDFEAVLLEEKSKADNAGIPFVVTECGNPGSGEGGESQPYEAIMPILHGYGIHHYIWELMIGVDHWRGSTGIFYPDGEVRSLSAAQAVLNGTGSFVEKQSDDPGYIELGFHENTADYIRDALVRMISLNTDTTNVGERMSLLFAMSLSFNDAGENLYFLAPLDELLLNIVRAVMAEYGINSQETYLIVDFLLPSVLGAVKE